MNNFSRRRFLVVGGQTILLSLAASCATTAPTPAPTVPASSATATSLPPTLAAPIVPSATPETSQMPNSNETVTLDLDAKIGQMLMLGFRGLELKPDDSIVQDIVQRNLGAVVLFSYDAALKSWTRNIESPAQLQALNASLQEYAQVPLLISTDQEGGIIARLTERFGFPPTESEKYYGTKNDAALTRSAAQVQGKLLREMGINLNLAPVVDLDLNTTNPIIGKYERSFSADPNIVTTQALAEIEGYHSQNILTTLKHYPGHGSSADDSHQGFVDVTNTWQEIELEPYRNIVKAGLADAIMTAHIFNSNLDAQYPATLSKKIITGILRDQLGYDGVVISDDMQMGAIRQYFGFEQAIELAIDAGVDILAIANNLVYEPDAAIRAVSIIKQLVNDGKISEQRIDESYQRIMKLKARIA